MSSYANVRGYRGTNAALQGLNASIAALSGGGGGGLDTNIITINGSPIALLGSTNFPGVNCNVITTNGSPLTLPSADQLLNIIRQGTPAAVTLRLPPNPTLNLVCGVKDGGNNFATYPATIVTTDGTQIDGFSGAVGFQMNQQGQQMWFGFDGTMWNRF